MKKLFIYIAFLGAALSLQSCLFEEKDIFDKSASERMTEAVNQASEVLKSAPNGWHLEYCPGENYSMGGINMFLKFGKEKVEVTSEMGGTLTPAGSGKSSYYRIIPEQSVMLTFDTYNDVIHYFGEPQGSNANLQGDYEFIIMKATEEEVILQGKRYKNKMRMVPVESGKTYSSIVNNLQKIPANAFLNSYEVYIGGSKFCVAQRSRNINTFVFSDGSAETEIPFIYTVDGFKFIKPFKVKGVELTHFAWKATENEAGKFVSVAEGPSVELVAYYPDNYKYYSDYVGKYEMTYDELIIEDNDKMYFETKSAEVTLTRKTNNSSYTIKGVPNAMVDMVVSYERASGEVAMNSGEYLGTFNGGYLYQNMGLDIGFYPLYYGISLSLNGYIVKPNNGAERIEFLDNGYGELYFGEKMNSILFEVYVSQTISSSTFYSAWACYRNIVLTKKD